MLVLLLVGLGWFWLRPGPADLTEKKTPHFEGSTPSHGGLVPGVPVNVVIDTNFDLATRSSISILHDGKDYGTGATAIDDNKLAMRRSIDPNAPDGFYNVQYTACWPDNTCHDGQFQFHIDRARVQGFADQRGQSAVTVSMKDIAFNPKTIRLSPGTKVTWVNDDVVEHYVNTDSHPAHTYLVDQNSRALKFGDT